MMQHWQSSPHQQPLLGIALADAVLAGSALKDAPLAGASLTGAPLTDAHSLGVVSDVVETSRHVCSVIAEISCLKKMLSSLEGQGAEIYGAEMI